MGGGGGTAVAGDVRWRRLVPTALSPLLGASVVVDDLPVHAAQRGRSAKVRTELDLHGFPRASS